MLLYKEKLNQLNRLAVQPGRTDLWRVGYRYECVGRLDWGERPKRRMVHSSRKEFIRRQVNRLLVFVGGAGVFFALVNLLVAAQIRHHGEVSPAALNITRECCHAVST